MKLKHLALFALLLVMAGCSVPSKQLSIFFFKEDKLVAVARELPTVEDPVSVAIDQLLMGPSDTETSQGIMTEIPNGTRAIDVRVIGDTAMINFNGRLAEYGGGTSKVRGILAQIVYTATGVKGVKKVILKLEGNDQFTLGSEGFTVDHPLERDDVKF